MQLLKTEIDEDDFCRKLRVSVEENDGNNFYLLFSNLLKNPTPSTLHSLLSTYSMDDVVNSLKHLIKYKYEQLETQIALNIIKIVEILLEYDENFDTLIVNLLRYDLVSQVNNIYKIRQNYFINHPNSLLFLDFFLSFTSERTTFITPLENQSRDFLFMKVHGLFDSNNYGEGNKLKNHVPIQSGYCFPLSSYFTEQEFKVLFTPTQPNILSSTITAELEMNLIFMLDVTTNFNFYAFLLFKNYIKSEQKAINALRFLSTLPHAVNIEKVVKAILSNYPSTIIALIYDLLFYNQVEPINGNLAELIRANADIQKKVNELSEHWEPLALAQTSIISKRIEYRDVGKLIYSLNFSRYASLINEMKQWKKSIVPKEHYEKIIKESFSWDGYAQVYLWKILAWQKIFLGYEIGEIDGGSAESTEGIEFIKYLN